jgi:hypothetical protein
MRAALIMGLLFVAGVLAGAKGQSSNKADTVSRGTFLSHGKHLRPRRFRRTQRHGRFTDTWVNQNGTWQCVASQSTLIPH